MRPEPLVLPFESGPILHPRCTVCWGWIHRPKPAGQRWTYAMQRESWVKIGMTGNVRERLGVLSRATEGCLVVHPPQMDWTAPLRLLVALPGDIEHELHDRFRAYHVIGEWFTPGDELVEWLDRHKEA